MVGKASAAESAAASEVQLRGPDDNSGDASRRLVSDGSVASGKQEIDDREVEEGDNYERKNRTLDELQQDILKAYAAFDSKFQQSFKHVALSLARLYKKAPKDPQDPIARFKDPINQMCFEMIPHDFILDFILQKTPRSKIESTVAAMGLNLTEQYDALAKIAADCAKYPKDLALIKKTPQDLFDDEYGPSSDRFGQVIRMYDLHRQTPCTRLQKIESISNPYSQSHKLTFISPSFKKDLKKPPGSMDRGGEGFSLDCQRELMKNDHIRPHFFQDGSTMRTLTLSPNIPVIPPQIIKLQKLEVLHANTAYLPPEVSTLPNLKVLTMLCNSSHKILESNLEIVKRSLSITHLIIEMDSTIETTAFFQQFFEQLKVLSAATVLQKCQLTLSVDQSLDNLDKTVADLKSALPDVEVIIKITIEPLEGIVTSIPSLDTPSLDTSSLDTMLRRELDNFFSSPQP